MAPFTNMAGAEVFADQSSCNTLLGDNTNACSWTPEAGLTGG